MLQLGNDKIVQLFFLEQVLQFFCCEKWRWKIHFSSCLIRALSPHHCRQFVGSI